MKLIVIILSLFLCACAQKAIVPDLEGIKRVPVNSQISDKPFTTSQTKGQ